MLYVVPDRCWNTVVKGFEAALPTCEKSTTVQRERIVM